MKIRDIINKIDKSEENEDWVDVSLLCNEFNLYDYYGSQNRLKSYWLGNWCCTDTWVGYKLYFLDDEPVCFSIQKARKSDEVFKWFSKELAIKTKEYILSLISEDEEELNWDYCDVNEDIGDSYKIHYNGQVTNWSKATLNGEFVKFIERIRHENDWGIDKEVKIQLNNGEEKIVNIQDLDFKYHLIESESQ